MNSVMNQKLTRSLLSLKSRILTYIAELCPLCQGSGWLGTCDCDPDGMYECYGQGSCGMTECPLCHKLNIQHAKWELWHWSYSKVHNYLRRREPGHVSHRRYI